MFYMMTFKHRFLVLTFLLAISFNQVNAGHKVANDTVKILWVGSSSTYCHDLPYQTGQWLEDYFAPRPVKTYLVGKSGTGFHEYLETDFEAQYGLKQGQTLLDKIRDENYDFVVLQMITYFIGADLREETEKSTEILVKAIRDAGGEPVFYEMGWRLGPENEIGRQLIAAAAKKHNIKYYGSCSEAWKAVRADKPSLELHNLPDSDHPGTLGTYLNICSMYVAFTGKKPKDQEIKLEVWPRFGSFDKELAGEKLKTVSLDYYHQVMPDWMQKISVMRTDHLIEKKTARYLQKQAYQTWKQNFSQLAN